MRVSGLLSLLIILFLASENHDKIVRVAGVFGVIDFIICSIELLKSGHKNLFLFGVLCLLIFLINYLDLQQKTGHLVASHAATF